MTACSKRPQAIARIKGGAEHPSIRGELRFRQECGRVLVAAHISVLPEDGETGFFGFHIHEGKSCGGENFSDTGGHYNPTLMPHPCHAGDLPPLMRCGGEAHMVLRTDRFRVEDIIGRTVVIHGEPDDFRSQPAGNAGMKIACGVIRKA